MRFRISTSRGRIVEFLVQLEFLLDGEWKPVARYDNAHEFAHRDLLDPAGKDVEKTPLKLGSLSEVLEFAEQDLKDRTEWYIENFLEMRKTD